MVFSKSPRQILGFNFERDHSSPSFLLSVGPLVSFEQVPSQTMHMVGVAVPSEDGMKQWHNSKIDIWG